VLLFAIEERKREGVFADINRIAIMQPMRCDQFFIDKRSVFTFQVDKYKSIADRIDLGETARFSMTTSLSVLRPIFKEHPVGK
jgi:hypothetical protein